MWVQVDQTRCQGHTMCAMHAPEVFAVRDVDGHAVLLLDGEVPADLQAGVSEAADGCPERAILIQFS